MNDKIQQTIYSIKRAAVNGAIKVPVSTKDLSALVAEVERYREALEHYADGEWICRYDGLVGHRCYATCTKTTLRGGNGYDAARAALSESQEPR